MMALKLAKIAYSNSTYRCLYSLKRTLSSNSENDTTPLIVETTLPFIGYRCEPPPRSVETSPKELLSSYKDMSIMRRMEISADSLYKSGLVKGFCHLYDGQEAIAVGVKVVTSQTDCVITAYRDHCLFLARGGSLLEVFAELLGKKDGCSLGKGGSMHLYKKENRFYGGHGIVGAHIPLGCGLAFALKYEKVDGVSVTLYGDGAANQGQLYEALNMAALWNLPVVLVCENNHYGMGTAEWRAAKCSAYYKRGHYVPGLKVDGMDVLAVKQAVKFGKDHALKNGPIILEMDTYRYHGHSMSDPGSTYRTRDEITTFRQERDPIGRVRKLLLEKELASPDELKNIDKEVKQMVNDAVAQAKVQTTMIIEKDKLQRFLKDGQATFFVHELKYGYQWRRTMDNLRLFELTCWKLNQAIKKNHNVRKEELFMLSQIQERKNIVWMEGPLSWTAWVDLYFDILH